jgi:uncharacterized repeat protein (TIGR03803 family)
MRKFNWGVRACGILLLWATAAVAVPAQTFKTLVTFDAADGEQPEAGLVQGTDGNFYGTTYGGGGGGAKGPCISTAGCGTVFTITPNGGLGKLHSFDYPDGAYPYAGLIQAANGDFYGTTGGGGADNDGTVFKLTPGGNLTTLYNFGHGGHGNQPDAGLVQGTNGDFYGATASGGANHGTVFSITPSGGLTTLHSFDGADGDEPIGGLVPGTDGNFYGTTAGGGANNAGTVFKITPSGALTTLYNFCSQTNCTDGASSQTGLVQATDGDFYGTTLEGGANNAGTVFKITPSGALTTLHSFDGTDGGYPYAGLIQGVDGKLYGTTPYGGANNAGTVFKITLKGDLTTLYDFCSQANCADGELR